MVGVYFSGTGNTKFCTENFPSYYEGNVVAFSIEDEEVLDAIKENEEIVFAYQVYYSNMPKIVHDFIDGNRSIFPGKKIFVIATMGLFSGDGAGCAVRLFGKCGADITGGLHLKMPDCIGDECLLVVAAEDKI